MSVIPFVYAGGNGTIVTTRVDFEKYNGLAGDKVLIVNLDLDQLENPRNCNASYDLRVGSEYRDHRQTGKTELGTEGTIELQPGAAVIIETEEQIQLPMSRFGHIVPKVSLLQKGISNTSSKIDPGYDGKLLITLFNLGKQSIKIKRGDKFCTLYMLEISGPVRPYSQASKRIMGVEKKDYKRSINDFLQRNQTIISFIALIFSVISTLLVAIVGLK